MLRFPFFARTQQPGGFQGGTFGVNPAQTSGGGPPLAAGTISFSSVAQTSLTVSCTAATGGTAPYTYQFQRSTNNVSFSNVGPNSSATSYGDSGLTKGTFYFYRVVVTDSVSAHATSASAGRSTSGGGKRRWFPGLNRYQRVMRSQAR